MSLCIAARAHWRLAGFSLITLSCLLVAGCATPRAERPGAGEINSPDVESPGRDYSRISAPLGAWSATGSVHPEPLLASGEDEQKDVPTAQRVVVYNAGFRLVVQNIEETQKNLEQLAAELGGYVQAIKGTQITIRVPAKDYQAAVQRVEALGQVAERELEALDVTEECVDLQARLNNARNVHKRLQALLEKTENVQAALAVEKELDRVSGEIDRLEAKLELLRKRIAFSTISVQLERVARQTEQLRGYQQLPFHWLRELDPNRLWIGN